MWWFFAIVGCGDPTPVATERVLPTPEVLEAHCREVIGEPRIEQVSPRVWVALGYDLANTILISTDDGNVVVDVGMNPDRAGPAREALLAVSPGPIRHIVYTHSHIDHVGGAEAWVEEGTRIWATEHFVEHFFKQYGTFLPAESARAQRQFGHGVALEDLPCSALGRRVDLVGTLQNGTRMPTDVFSGEATLEVGDLEISLVEAHGETHDQLFVWVPSEGVLLPGDNWYEAFPNLYTIRGSKPRPVDDWIASLDAMRRLEPEILVPSHTRPVRGAVEVQDALRDYRDAIQWIRDAVVRGANEGLEVDALVHRIGLPAHLTEQRAVAELYGQIDWSVRAIYGNELGWFDGMAADLYPLHKADLAGRTIAAMGGPEDVAKLAADADDARWAVHLFSLLEATGMDVDEELASAYEAVGETVFNTNGRGYLLRAAHERRNGVSGLGEPVLSDDFVASIPLDMIFDSLAVRLKPATAMDVHESVLFRFGEDQYALTIRRGVAELVKGEPLPGTPEPIATVATDPTTWRRIALNKELAVTAIADGRLEIDGSELGFVSFMSRFDRGMAKPPSRLP